MLCASGDKTRTPNPDFGPTDALVHFAAPNDYWNAPESAAIVYPDEKTAVPIEPVREGWGKNVMDP